MSLEVTPEALYREVEAARIYWDRANAIGSRMIQRYTTPAYSGSDGAPAPENYHYHFVLNTMARLTMGRIEPRFATERRDASDRVRGLEDFCRRWVQDTGWDNESERCKLDMCFYGSAAAVFVQKARAGYEQFDDPPQTPIGNRLPPGMFGADPLASSWEEVRHAYHIVVDFKNDLIKQAETEKGVGWDIEAIKSMSESGSFANSLRNKGDYSINRKEVAHYQIWVPGYELPDNDPFWRGVDDRERKKYHGTIFRLAACHATSGGASTVPRFICKPQGYFGPRQGPYCFAGFLTVPDQVRKLSPMVANDGQIEQLNAQVRANDVLATKAKTGFVMNGVTEDANVAFRNFKHGEAFIVPGFDKAQFERLEVGGPGPEAIQREMELRSRVARALAIPDIAQGQVTGTGTATENALAGQHQDMTADFLDRKALSIDEQMIMHVAWCADQDDSTTIQSDGEVHVGGSTPQEHWRAIDRVQRVGMIDAEGAKEQKSRVLQTALDSPDSPDTSFDDLEIKIERIRQDPQSRAKLTEAWNLALQVAPVLPLMAQFAPGFQAMMERSADELGIAELGTLFDAAAAQQVAEEQQEQAEAQAETPRTMPAPKTAGAAGGGFQRKQPGAETNSNGPKVVMPKAAGAKK